MTAKDALRMTINMGRLISTSYLEDLSDADLLHRPHPDCNHINWQLGHLIASEHNLINHAIPDCMPPLPPGFADRYTKETARSNDPAAFETKTNLMRAFESQRAGTLAALERIPEAELERATGLSYAPTVAALFEMQGSHWVMHAGQWAVIRRQLGRPPLF